LAEVLDNQTRYRHKRPRRKTARRCWRGTRMWLNINTPTSVHCPGHLLIHRHRYNSFCTVQEDRCRICNGALVWTMSSSTTRYESRYSSMTIPYDRSLVAVFKMHQRACSLVQKDTLAMSKQNLARVRIACINAAMIVSERYRRSRYVQQQGSERLLSIGWVGNLREAGQEGRAR
jgi:hypothetical protein